MNANELLHYLRGFAELVDQPTPAQWAALRNEILRASSVENQFIPVPAHFQNETPRPCGGCGGKSAPLTDAIPRGVETLVVRPHATAVVSP